MDKKTRSKNNKKKKSNKNQYGIAKKDVEENPDSYQYERVNKFLVRQRCIGYALRRLAVAYKKTLVIQRRTKKNVLCLKIE